MSQGGYGPPLALLPVWDDSKVRSDARREMHLLPCSLGCP